MYVFSTPYWDDLLVTFFSFQTRFLNDKNTSIYILVPNLSSSLDYAQIECEAKY